MDYKKHYDNLIIRAKDRTLEGYVEQHHILPKCLGGDNSPDNLVLLTPEEHYLAHQLLVKMNPGNYGLIKAAHLMTIHQSNNRINNKKYGWLRRRFSESQKEYMKKNHPKGFKGKKHSNESKDKIQQASKRIAKLKSKKVYQWKSDGTYVRSFESISAAAIEVEASPSNIKYCCEGKFNHVKQFIWTYEKCKPIPLIEMHLQNRRVQTPDGIFNSVKEVMKYYNFSSSSQVRARCLKEKFAGWHYLD